MYRERSLLSCRSSVHCGLKLRELKYWSVNNVALLKTVVGPLEITTCFADMEMSCTLLSVVIIAGHFSLDAYEHHLRFCLLSI